MATQYLSYPDDKKQIVESNLSYSSKLRQGLVAHKEVQVDWGVSGRCIEDYRPTPTDKITTSKVKIMRNPSSKLYISIQAAPSGSSIDSVRRIFY